MLALALHGAAAWALLQGWNPDKELLNFVKPQTVVANLVVIQPKAKPKPAVDPNAAAKAAQERKAREQRAAERKAQELKAQEAAAEKRRQDEAERQAKEAEAKRLAEEQARHDRLAKLSEMAATSLEQAIAEESADLNAGTEEMVVRSYHAAIYDLVRRNWSRPPSSRTGMWARLQVELIPTGEVIAVTLVESSGNPAFNRSAEHAVRMAKRFDVPEDNALFERHFRRFYFLFQPEDLLR